jgi:hypothetical protein
MVRRDIFGYLALTTALVAALTVAVAAPVVADVAPSGRLCFSVAGSPGDVALVNLTPVLAQGPGNGQLISSDVTTPPVASNVNYQPGSIDPNVAAARIGADGKVCYVNSVHTNVHLVADHLGTIDAAAYTTATPNGAPDRKIDTRICRQAVVGQKWPAILDMDSGRTRPLFPDSWVKRGILIGGSEVVVGSNCRAYVIADMQPPGATREYGIYEVTLDGDTTPKLIYEAPSFNSAHFAGGFLAIDESNNLHLATYRFNTTTLESHPPLFPFAERRWPMGFSSDGRYVLVREEGATSSQRALVRVHQPTGTRFEIPWPAEDLTRDEFPNSQAWLSPDGAHLLVKYVGDPITESLALFSFDTGQFRDITNWVDGRVLKAGWTASGDVKIVHVDGRVRGGDLETPESTEQTTEVFSRSGTRTSAKIARPCSDSPSGCLMSIFGNVHHSSPWDGDGRVL